MKILDYAKIYLGMPYVWGGDDIAEEGGFDCSGYVYNVLKDCGYTFPRDTAQGYFNRFKNNECNLNTPGALIFFGQSKNKITHIAINIDGIHMYESMGNKSNTKKKPGKGVVKSLIVRRKDLVAVCTVESVSTSTVKKSFVIPQPTLRRGSHGRQVDYLQTALNCFGYLLKIDGIFGEKTFRALANWQMKNNLEIDGIYGKKSYEKMRELYYGN